MLPDAARLLREARAGVGSGGQTTDEYRSTLRAARRYLLRGERRKRVEARCRCRVTLRCCRLHAAASYAAAAAAILLMPLRCAASAAAVQRAMLPRLLHSMMRAAIGSR